MAKEVTRHITKEVTYKLWWKAAGRCQFSGCNKPVWKSSVTQETANIAQRAHIYSFSEKGPRGRGPFKRRPKCLNDIENLMLMCHECHTKIDQNSDGGRYSGELLIQWKREHERRIELITGINPSKKSTVIHYKAPIGNFSPDWDDHDSLSSLFPLRYPERDYAIDLSAKIEKKDSDEGFYEVYKEDLEKVFSKKVEREVEDGDISHYPYLQ